MARDLKESKGRNPASVGDRDPIACPTMGVLPKDSEFSGSDEIFRACCMGDLVRVRSLLEKNVPVNLKDIEGRKSTPLHVAAGYGKLEVVKLLISRGADVSVKDGGGKLFI